MTNTKAIFCEEIVRSLHLSHNIIQLIYATALRLNHPTDFDSLTELQWKLFGHQFVGWKWDVRRYVAANNPYLSDALFDKKSDDCCVRFAQSHVWRRTRGASYTSGKGPKATHIEMRVLLRDLSKAHDWNTCK